jgi:hypothetical protein
LLWSFFKLLFQPVGAEKKIKPRRRPLFSRRLPLAHNSRMQQESRRDVITKHSVFIRFALTFRQLVSALVAHKFHVVNVFIAFDFVASYASVHRNLRVHQSAFFKAVFHLLFGIGND